MDPCLLTAGLHEVCKLSEPRFPFTAQSMESSHLLYRVTVGIRNVIRSSWHAVGKQQVWFASPFCLYDSPAIYSPWNITLEFGFSPEVEESNFRYQKQFLFSELTPL